MHTEEGDEAARMLAPKFRVWRRDNASYDGQWRLDILLLPEWTIEIDKISSLGHQQRRRHCQRRAQHIAHHDFFAVPKTPLPHL